MLSEREFTRILEAELRRVSPELPADLAYIEALEFVLYLRGQRGA